MFRSILISTFFLCSSLTTAQYTTEPQFPGLTYLYSCNATIDLNIVDYGENPFNHRVAYPIIGGYFKGPKLNGTFANLGADWGTVDRDGIFHPDTRYSGVTDDGAKIYFRTNGHVQKDNRTHLYVHFETGHKDYYYLNYAVAMGVLTTPNPDIVPYVLIDVWMMGTPSGIHGTEDIADTGKGKLEGEHEEL